MLVRSREGERKQVTVLFADVAGSMELAERLDADDLAEVMQGLFAVCREAVESVGGTVDKFTGDGVMALFGAPVAQEDHARRAAHAALRLVAEADRYALTLRRQGVELLVRVGLNSGEVIAGAVGETYTALGHTVGLAQRMESLAEPGTVCLTEHTAALVGTEFLLRDLGPTPVKGSSVLVRMYALDAAGGGSSSAGRRRAGSARLVGRDTEFAALRSDLHAAMDGRGSILALIGEAGSGKSRLCDELARHAAELGVTVRRTAGVSHARSVPLLPILGFLRDYFGVVDGDAPATIRARVADGMPSGDAASRADLALLFDFMEVPDPERPPPQLGPDERRRRVLRIFRRATQRRSGRQSLLLILEDLHWFDPHSVAFLQAWLPSFAGTRTLVLTNFRPEFRAVWTDLPAYRPLTLAPLDDSAALELLEELLGTDPSLGALSADLCARTGGNPFFVEEIVRALAADGTLDGVPGAYWSTRPAAEVRVPATVQAVLAERIDRLAPQEKAALAAASVIGRTFTESILRDVVGLAAGELSQALRTLCAGELLAELGPDGDYRFWHPLTQEVAYGTLLAATRRRLHHAAAESLIASGPDRHDELAPLIATHVEAAGEHLAAAQWQLRAGTRAVRADFAEAQRRWRAALEHLATLAETPQTLALGVQTRTLLLRVGARAGMDIAEADRLFAAARAAAERLGNPAQLAGLWAADGTVRLWQGEAADALASYSQARGPAEQAGDRGLRAFARTVPAAGHLYAGPIPDGVVCAEAAIELCGDDPTTGTALSGYSAYDLAHFFLAFLAVPGGRLDEADRAARRTLTFYEQRPMAEWHAWMLTLFAHLADCRGESESDLVDEALVAAGAAMRLAEESGNVGATVRALQAQGIAALLGARPGEAEAALSEGLAQARKHRSGLMEEASLLAYLARAHLALGDGPTARAAADEAVAVARRQGARVLECLAQAVRARVLRETAAGAADRSEARAALIAGEALAVQTGAGAYAAFLAEERARLDGDLAALAAAAEGYDAIGATGHANRVRAELATGTGS